MADFTAPLQAKNNFYLGARPKPVLAGTRTSHKQQHEVSDGEVCVWGGGDYRLPKHPPHQFAS